MHVLRPSFLAFLLAAVVSAVPRTADAASNCCSAHAGKGCDFGACAGCVCMIDPYCCNNSWDGLCVAEALGACAASCPCSTCGDSEIDPDEQCEAPFDACCDSSTCRYKPASTVCRAGSGDTCDPVETCSGQTAACPADVRAPAGTACRAALSACDLAEACTGQPGAACPADVFAPKGSDCDDGDPCTDDACDGNGSCMTWENDDPCSDGDACTVGDRCAVGICVSGAPADCDDGSPCTADSCDSASGCRNVADTVAGCFQAGKVLLTLHDDDDDDKDKLKWRWKKGGAVPASALGSPDVDTTYGLCVFDQVAGNSELVAEVLLTAGSSFWSSGADDVAYADAHCGGDGACSARAFAGTTDGKTKAMVTAAGAALDPPAHGGDTFLHADPAVIVQLRNSEGACWTSVYPADSVKKNDAVRFRAVAR